MHRIERRLITDICVDGSHIALGDANGVIQNLGYRCQTVCRAGCVRNDNILFCHRLVIYAIDNSLVGILARR